ncbi:MAG: hypothetical protein HW395_59 [candidate division NC10 bacterium]|nr:hypothetical protein [candidate division NC10 bacterium]
MSREAEALPVVVTSSFQWWLEEGQKLGRVARCFQWAIAAWVLDGERQWGDRATQAACEATGLAPQTVLNILSVARAFPDSRRREALSFGHHAALTALPPAEQDRLLDLAEKAALSVTALRREAAGARHGRSSPNAPIPPMTRTFEMMAERVRAGEPWEDVLADYELGIEHGAPDVCCRDLAEHAWRVKAGTLPHCPSCQCKETP